MVSEESFLRRGKDEEGNDDVDVITTDNHNENNGAGNTNDTTNLPAHDSTPQQQTAAIKTADEDVEAVANIAVAALLEQQQQQNQLLQQQQQQQNRILNLKPPSPLPLGWILREARSHPDHYFYYNQETGESTWEPPFGVERFSLPNPSATDESAKSIADAVEAAYARAAAEAAAIASAAAAASTTPPVGIGNDTKYDIPDASDGFDNSMNASSDDGRRRNTLKREADTKESSGGDAKKMKPSLDTSESESIQSKPSKVRILHILKKHKDARRPSSWRRPTITISKEEATVELQGLIDILREVQETNDIDELRATFEELARTESDCNSAKRGGDLGFFGPKKMQPAFEDASFALKINEMSGIVETSSGVHVLLRVG